MFCLPGKSWYPPLLQNNPIHLSTRPSLVHSFPHLSCGWVCPRERRAEAKDTAQTSAPSNPALKYILTARETLSCLHRPWVPPWNQLAGGDCTALYNNEFPAVPPSLEFN